VKLTSLATGMIQAPPSPVSIGKSAAGGPLTIGGKVFEDGIGLQGPTDLHVPLRGMGGRLTMGLGVDDAGGRKGSVVVQVLVDDRPVYVSKVLRAGRGQELRLQLPKGRRLTISVEDARDGREGDYLNVVNPVLVTQ
jgi:hypothetical protein